MNIVIPHEEFDINNIFYERAVKNTILNDGNFIRIIYSTDICCFSGICMHFKMPIDYIDKSFNKYKCVFNIDLNAKIIENISTIERNIISKYNLLNRQPTYRVSEQLQNGKIKVTRLNKSETNSEQLTAFNIKISGLWCNEEEYGLTYKFIQV